MPDGALQEIACPPAPGGQPASFPSPAAGQNLARPLSDGIVKALCLLLILLAPPALAQTPVPDFSLRDENPGSRRRGVTAQFVSPRDYLHQVTAWYFGHEN